MPTSLITYWRTVKHLRREQVLNRLWRRLPTRPLPNKPAPPLRQSLHPFGEPIMRRGPIREHDLFHFLNRTGRVTQVADWDDPRLPKLWRYNLHYFDWLREQAATGRLDDDAAWIDRWIQDNAAVHGTGWEPYPLSLRIVNWIVWFLTIGAPTPSRLHSLAHQIRQLERTIETHLLGNHLFVNAKALVFAGTFFRGEEADRWRMRGLEILQAQIPEQILADGGHFELSTMYHALCVEDVLDLIGLEQSYPDVLKAAFAPLDLVHVAERMGVWLAHMSHPDGDISYFNDAACGIAPSLDLMTNYARRRGIQINGPRQRLTRMDASGYARLAIGRFVCIFDCGRIGPDYLPGHAHGDTLSFELSLGDERLITNSGTSTYEVGSDREWERGTPAHSTVKINGENSAETWSGFRVGRRPKVGPTNMGDTGNCIWVESQHDGYAHLQGAPTHKRRVTLNSTSIEIIDTVGGRGIHEASGFLHIHPGVKVSDAGHGHFMLVTSSGAKVTVCIDVGAESCITEGRFAEGFGKVVPRKTLAWRRHSASPFEVRCQIRVVSTD